MKKKFLALVMTLSMVLSLVPMTALATGDNQVDTVAAGSQSAGEDANGGSQDSSSTTGGNKNTTSGEDSTNTPDTNTNNGNKGSESENAGGTESGGSSTSGTGTTEGGGTGTTTPPESSKNVAKIVETNAKYETLDAAIAEAEDGATIELLRDVTESITINRSLTLDLGGFTLTAEDNDRVIDVTPEVDLDVLEYNFKKHNITDPYFPDIGFGIGIFKESKFENIDKLVIPVINVKIMNGTITGGDVSGRKHDNLRFYGCGGGIRISSCNVEIADCTITGNKAQQGGGIFCSTSVVNGQPYSKVVITDCEVSNNTACYAGDAVTSAGGGISSCRCDLTLNGLTVSGNKAAEFGCDGGGITARGGKFYMQNTVVKDNEADDNAGGILLGPMYDKTIEEPIEFEISGGVVQKNSCIRNNGGGIYLDTVNKEENRIENKINGTTVEENTASSGGGIYVATRAKLTVEGDALILNNKATNTYMGGGGIYATIADLHLGNARITNNEAINGGGIFAQSAGSSKAELALSDGAQVEGNHATNGGGIFVRALGMSTMSAEIGDGASVKNNVAENGGGIYVPNGATINVAKGSALYNNTAGTAGDDLFLNGATFTLPKASKMSGGCILSSDNAEIIGWYHDGWYKWNAAANDGKGGYEQIDRWTAETADEYTPVAKDSYAITLKAAHPLMYTLTYNVTGDTPENYTAPKNQTLKANEKYTVAAVPESVTGTKDGVNGTFSFSGWSFTQGGTPVSGEQTLTKDVTLYGVWTFTKKSSSGGHRPSNPTVTIPDDVPTGLNGKDHYAYVVGYPDGMVYPQKNITRAEVATIFFRLLEDETREANMTKSNGYNDMKDGAWYTCAVSTLSKMGIIKGYEDGSFKPDASISRAEFAAIAARFDPDGDKTPATFSDVSSHWAKDEISIAANHGWIKGYEDGSFKPDQKITRAETMTLVNRVLKRLPETKDDLHKDMKTWPDNQKESAWFYLAVQEATNSHYQKLKKDGTHEKWESMRETRDWAALEK